MQERILDNTYRLLEEIGRGGFGAVYRAVRIGAEGSGQVAIKFLNRGSVLSLQEQIRFQREATLMSQLLHPGTVTVYELGETEGRAYIVMEYVDGPNLREYVRSRGGRLPLSEILGILIQAAEALEYVHGHNIVHRDIKPQNILVATAKEGAESKIHVKIVDFGVARLNDPVKQNVEAGRLRSEVVGTFSYMAPESTGLVSWGIDARADIYSLGIVAYELISGRTPFSEFKNDELLRAHTEKSPPLFSQFDGLQVPDVLERMVMKCIEKRPEDRYQSTFGLLSDLKKLYECLRSQNFESFEIATKDVALSRIFNNIFVGRGELVEQVSEIISNRQRKSRVTWSMIRSTVGLGRSRSLAEVRRRLDEQDIPYLHIRFTESEQRLSLRALSLAVNEQLQALEIRSPRAFQSLMQELALIANRGATDVARLIPALRPHLLRAVDSASQQETTYSVESGPDQEDDDDFAENFETQMKKRPPARQVVSVRAPVQQIFLELLAKIAQQNGYLVFLLDDLHLADPASIGLFQFITERVNDQTNFAFVMTIREGISRQNFVLDNFLARLANLRRRFHVWDLAPLNQYDFQQFLIAIGLPRPSPRFVEFVTAKCDGSPLLLHQLVKQMIETEALVPERRDFNPWSPVFRVDWTKLSQIVVDTRNVEALLASLDRLDKRDQRLTCIAAVSHEACEFEYFRIDQDFTSVELETRLLSLVRRGVFEILGDENLPVQRRAFVFSHEKLRSAVLSGLELQTRRQIHLAMANRITMLYPKPRREQVLSLAKHFEGAGPLADAERSSEIFLKAARIHARSFEHSLAKYYTERAMVRASGIGNQQERLNYLREVFETEYMIHIAQNELVAASDVCQQLVALTFDSQRKETLQIHWAHLLLGLGRHRMAYLQVAEAIDRKLVFPFSTVHKFITRVAGWLSGFGQFPIAYSVAQIRPLKKEMPTDNQIQGLMYLSLAQAHGVDGHSLGFLLAAVRMKLHRKGPTRSFAVFNMLIAAQFLRSGRMNRAFEIAETLERNLEAHGRVDIARWVRALRAIWLDYPMGRTERLARVLDERKEGQMPAFGVLNTESHALRQWIRATSPRLWGQRRNETATAKKDMLWNERVGMHAGGYVSDRVRGRRKIDALREKPNALQVRNEFADTHAPQASSDNQNAVQESLSQSKQARKLREAGENGQYLGLLLFSDVIRYALADKLDPLRRTVDQFSRQQQGGLEGEIFKAMSVSLQEFVSGQYKESLDSYVSALRAIVRRPLGEISLPVSDALRCGALIMPYLAFSMNVKGWPWKRSFFRLLDRVDDVLQKSEGIRNPRRTAFTPLFKGVMEYMKGESNRALRSLGEAKDLAKSGQNDLAALLAEQALGLICSEMDQVRCMDYFAECYRSAHDRGWKLLERQLLSLCRRLNLPLQHHFPELLAEAEKISFRRRTSGIALTHIIESWLVMKREPQTVNHYINQSARVGAKILSSPLSLLFVSGSEEKAIYKPTVQWVDDSNLFLQNLSDQPVGPKTLEVELVKYLPRFHDDPMRLVPVGAGDDNQDQHVWSLSPQNADEVIRDEQPMSEPATRILEVATQLNTRVDHAPIDTPYAVYVALKQADRFFGWMAMSRVSLSQFTSKDAEMDLLLLARHTAFNISFAGMLNSSTHHGEHVQMPSLEVVQLPFSEGIILEELGRLHRGDQIGTQIFSLGLTRVLMLNWSFEASSENAAADVGGLFRHYSTLLVESLRVAGEALGLDRFAMRFSADVGILLERAAVGQRFERVSVNAILLDTQANEAQECFFGHENVIFAGSSRVERELLLELGGVLRLDRLVYRERRRLLAGTQAGWLLNQDSRFREINSQFSQNGFIEEYLNQKRSRGLMLNRILANGHLPNEFSAIALLFDATQANKKNVA
ncbi:hypothetical protein EBU99_03735 [bacterium]|nr:hypothetical protein [bacterium]